MNSDGLSAATGLLKTVFVNIIFHRATMKLYVLREYTVYGETHSEATREQIRENEIVQQLIAEALEAERDDDATKFFDAQISKNNY